MSYSDFLAEKTRTEVNAGLETIPALSPHLYDFQRDIVTWALRRGKASIFAGTGLGKSLQELSWANAIHEATGLRVLIFTPLAVASQMKREANKFGIDCEHVSSHSESNKPILITNYQKLDHFDMLQFGGVVLDESSILKNATGHYRKQLITQCRDIPYRLAATATPSPNDFMELGNHAEFCGIMSYTDMLATFFCHDGGDTSSWRLKGHAEDKFWQWVASWAVMLQNPADLGYDGSKYNLPALHQIQHIVGVEYKPSIDTGLLFPLEAQSLGERLKARRSTIEDRCDKAAEIVADKPKEPWVIWCHLNDESSLLAAKIPGAVELRGDNSEKEKESILENFALGNIQTLITKPSIAGFGMNWQHCANTCFVGMNDSFEQIYQSIRRFWRFGQTREVYAHFIASEIEGAVVANIKKKEQQCEHMMRKMVEHMADICSLEIRGAKRETLSYNPSVKLEIPSWL